MSICVGRIGGSIVKIKSLEGDKPSLLRGNGVHLHDIGLYLFNLVIQTRIEKMKHQLMPMSVVTALHF